MAWEKSLITMGGLWRCKYHQEQHDWGPGLLLNVCVAEPRIIPPTKMYFFILDQNQIPPTSRSWPVHSRVIWPHVQSLRSCSRSLCDSAPITLFSARRSRVRSYWRPLMSRPYICASVKRFTRPLFSGLFSVFPSTHGPAEVPPVQRLIAQFWPVHPYAEDILVEVTQKFTRKMFSRIR